MINYDALIELYLLPSDEGGRERPIQRGYRPAHKIKEEYLTSGEINLIDVEVLNPGQSAQAYVNYLSPEAYPNSLWPGKEMTVQEGSRVVAKAKIIEVLNSELLIK